MATPEEKEKAYARYRKNLGPKVKTYMSRGQFWNYNYPDEDDKQSIVERTPERDTERTKQVGRYLKDAGLSDEDIRRLRGKK